jgi:hypothetical protein
MVLNNGPQARGNSTLAVFLSICVLWLAPFATAIYLFTLAADALPWCHS